MQETEQGVKTWDAPEVVGELAARIAAAAAGTDNQAKAEHWAGVAQEFGIADPEHPEFHGIRTPEELARAVVQRATSPRVVARLAIEEYNRSEEQKRKPPAPKAPPADPETAYLRDPSAENAERYRRSRSRTPLWATTGAVNADRESREAYARQRREITGR